MYEDLLDEARICGSKDERLFLNMLILRSNRKLQISGYLFKMDNKNYKDVGLMAFDRKIFVFFFLIFEFFFAFSLSQRRTDFIHLYYL